MLTELNRLITKYHGPDWNNKPTANRVVELLTEHRALVQTELNEVNTGVRKLTDRDFLGPKERERRRKRKLQDDAKNDEPATVSAASDQQEEDKKDYSQYFRELEMKIHEQRRRDMTRLAVSRGHAQREASSSQEPKKR